MTVLWKETIRPETIGCLLEAQEIERQQLAQELHDGPLQGLHSLDFGLVALTQQGRDAETKQQLAQMRTVLQGISRRLRTICQDLRPPALGPFGLSVVLRSYAEAFQLLYPNIQVELSLVEDEQQLPQLTRVTLYRIFQHALRNVAQHAQATQVRIALFFADEQVVLRIEDDGRGFEVPQAWLDWASQGRFGLFECLQRAGAIGGELQIETQPGRGVRLDITVPYGPNTTKSLP